MHRTQTSPRSHRNMTEQDRIASNTASWFLLSEDGGPLGQIYRSGERVEPVVGEMLANNQRWKRAEVVSFRELPSTCAMRRFQVIIRIVE